MILRLAVYVVLFALVMLAFAGCGGRGIEPWLP